VGGYDPHIKVPYINKYIYTPTPVGRRIKNRL
jgi:hypothetical protein